MWLRLKETWLRVFWIMSEYVVKDLTSKLKHVKPKKQQKSISNQGNWPYFSTKIQSRATLTFQAKFWGFSCDVVWVTAWIIHENFLGINFLNCLHAITAPQKSPFNIIHNSPQSLSFVFSMAPYIDYPAFLALLTNQNTVAQRDKSLQVTKQQ